MAYRKTSGAPGSTSKFAPEIKTPQQAEQEAQELLASFGSRILEMLKAGGDKARQFDNAYATKVRDVIYPESIAGKDRIDAMPRGFAAAIAGTPVGRSAKEFDLEMSANPSRAEEVLAAITPYALQASSAGLRYGLPLGVAAKAADLTGKLYNAASEEEIF